MQIRKIANDIWLAESVTARKTAYVGMIRLLLDGKYVVGQLGQVFGPYETLEEAEKFFEEDNSINTK